MFNLLRPFRDIDEEGFRQAITIDFLPQLLFATQLGTLDDSRDREAGLDILRERYKKDVPCPRLAEYKRASKSLREIYDAIHSSMIKTIYV